MMGEREEMRDNPATGTYFAEDLVAEGHEDCGDKFVRRGAGGVRVGDLFGGGLSGRHLSGMDVGFAGSSGNSCVVKKVEQES